MINKTNSKSIRTHEPMWALTCDDCGVRTTGQGETPGDAADQARKEGFSTKPGPTLTEPLTWACSGCATQKKN